MDKALIMRIRWLIALAVVIASGTAVAFWAWHPDAPKYLTTVARKGDVQRFVVTTGNVNPVVTVQVGTYVSGPIQAIYCDYNTKVKAGQLCAKIDPKSFQVAVNEAEANLASAKAQLAKDRASLANAETTYKRDRRLRRQGIVSQEQIDSEKSAYDQAAAQVKLDEATILQRQGALEAAQVNLEYTNIVSPVDGTVVSRNVNVGQTVAASFQTPTLFLIAQDLTKMQVDTNVSESDIGAVKVGQRATFTVDAYQGKNFEGEVTQIRRAPITVQNVVTYDAVISVANPESLLFPGMTASVRIVTDERKDVLEVPLQALQFSPKGEQPGPAPESPQQGRVWIAQDDKAVSVPVSVGLKGANSAEITGGNLKPGDKVITGEVTGSNERRSGPPRSPFGVH